MSQVSKRLDERRRMMETAPTGNIELFTMECPGNPRPQGSKRLVDTRRGMRMIESNDHQLRSWRDAVTRAALIYRPHGFVTLDEPVFLRCWFKLARPPSHMRSGGLLRKGKPEHKTSKPDLSHLVRAVEDSLTDGRVWRDDSLVVGCESYKTWCIEGDQGVRLSIWGVG